jgi:uncharacterized phage protein (TIGR02218 family)
VKTASVGLTAHLAGDVTTLATCWRLQRTDGLVLGFTDHDRDLVVSATTYRASTGYQRSAIASRADLSVDENEITGILNAAEITEADLRAGLWDGAEVRIFLVNHQDLTMGDVKLRRGQLGEVMVNDDGTFRSELRGLSQALQQTVGEQYTPECRADLGDARCRIPISLAFVARSTAYAVGSFLKVATDGAATGSLREEGRIYECTTAGTTAASAPTFSTTIGATTTDGTVVWTARQAWALGGRVQASPDLSQVQAENLLGIGGYANGWFDGGVLTFESGLNAGISRDVVDWIAATRTAVLFLPLPYTIAAGDVFRIAPGCDKRLATCRDKFGNRLNFRGEPFVPGGNALIDTPE